jgi:hypothetical protein
MKKSRTMRYIRILGDARNKVINDKIDYFMFCDKTLFIYYM